MKKLILFFILVTATIVSMAAPSPVYTSAQQQSVTKGPSGIFQVLQAHRQGKNISVFWMMADQGLAVNSFTVFKTYEDPADPYAVWTPVATMNGQSGRMYRVNDTSVLPGYNSYRIAVLFSDGTVEFSEVRTVRVVQH